MSQSNVIVITHTSCARHETGFGHPERPERLSVILEMLDADLPDIEVLESGAVTDTQILKAHSREYLDSLIAQTPKSGLVHIDPDTVLSPGSLDAARHAAGAAVMGVDQVMTGNADAAFCAIRPPGHHAEAERAMGFCLFNNAYIAARHAQDKHGVGKVAIVDFDVHHGNGTADMIYQHRRPDIFYASTHQFPLFPGTGDPTVDDDAGGLILDVPLPAGTHSEGFRTAYTDKILPALKAFGPDLLILSAGFDAHKDDPVGGMTLDEEDFRWVTAALKAVNPRIVSVLEGGYDLNALANSVRAHLEALRD
jgi:acetoin utilization deacetylase AcuC-like enzyme